MVRFFTLFLLLATPTFAKTTTLHHILSHKNTKLTQRFNAQTSKVKRLLHKIYAGELNKTNINFLKHSLTDEMQPHLNNWYFHDKSDDNFEKEMPDWDIEDLRKLMAFGPLLFTEDMRRHEKHKILSTLYHSPLIKRNDIKRTILCLNENIPLIAENLSWISAQFTIVLIEAAELQERPQAFIKKISKHIRAELPVKSRLNYIASKGLHPSFTSGH